MPANYGKNFFGKSLLTVMISISLFFGLMAMLTNIINKTGKL